MVQLARPRSDISNQASAWITEPLWPRIDEITADDTDYVQVTLSLNITREFEVKLTPLVDPLSSANHILRVRAKGSGNGPKIRVSLYQGVTLIAPLSPGLISISGTWTEFSDTLTAAEADAITNYRDLRIRIRAQKNSGGFATIQISWAQLEVGDVPAGQIPVVDNYVRVDWDGDGGSSGSGGLDDEVQGDITLDALSLRWVRGREEELENTPAGTLEIEVSDPDGDYSPENTASRFGSGNVEVGRKVQISMVYKGVEYIQFTGTIERIVPHPSPNQKTAYLLVADGMHRLARRRINAPSGGIFTSKKIGDDPGPLETVLDEAGWPAADRSLDAGIDTLDEWWAHDQFALDAIHDLETAEAAFMYVDESGKFIYEDRHHRLGDGGGGATDHLTSQATFSNVMEAMPYRYDSKTVRNIVFVRGHKRTAKTIAQLWGTRDRPYIGPGETITIWAVLANPATGINAPASTTNWKANTASDGSGDDKTSDVSLTSTIYGQSVKMVLTNNAAVGVYIVPGTVDVNDALYIDGDEYDDDEVVAMEEDSGSQTTHGERTLDIDTIFKGQARDLADYASWLLSRFKDPQPDMVRMELINKTDALTEQILSRKLSDRITVTATQLGISAQDYFINRMEHIVDQGSTRHRVIYSLARVGEETYWALGKTGYSELGQTTRLAF